MVTFFTLWNSALSANFGRRLSEPPLRRLILSCLEF
jgi:hypothetical protein